MTSTSRDDNIKRTKLMGIGVQTDCTPDEIKILRNCKPEFVINALKNKNKYPDAKLVQFIVYDLFQESSVLRDLINGWKTNQIEPKLFCDQIWVMPIRLKIIAKQSPIIRFFESESMSIPFRVVPRLVQASLYELVRRSTETVEEIDNETKMYALGKKEKEDIEQEFQEEEEKEQQKRLRRQQQQQQRNENVHYESGRTINFNGVNGGSNSPFQFLEKDKTNFCLMYSKFNYDTLLNEMLPRLEIMKSFIRSTINLESTMRYSYHQKIQNIIEILTEQQEGNSADILISEKLLSINISTLRTLLSKIEKADFDLTQLDKIKVATLK